MVKTTLHALVHQGAAERPGDLENPAFIDEIAALLADYLAGALGRSRRTSWV